MNICAYFLKHPTISIILNIMILLVGMLCYQSLSIREYPDISFPIITVNTSYPNASPQLIETEVTNILEDQLAGIQGLELITSQSNAGNSNITMLFRAGSSMEKALNATQDAVGLARSLFPAAVKPPRIERQKQSDGLPFIGLSIESSSMDVGELTHYAHLNLKNAFRGLNGVASVSVFGQPYTYEINLDAKKLHSFGINADEVADALALNSLSLPAGKYQNIIPTTLDFDLITTEDYKNLLIKTVNNHPVLLRSLADVQLKTDKEQFKIGVNGHSGLVLSINRSNDANPLEVSKAVHKELKLLKKNLPNGMKITPIIDQSEFIKASLRNIKSSIIESILLVLITVFVFLRNSRAIIIPLVTIPISLLGSLLFLKLFGFSINQMTLLAMVLAVGLVVDDAIIVLENIWRHIEEGMTPMQASLKGSKQISFAIVAMTLTLASVYAPLAFMDGMLGQLFIEFAVALAGSVIISGVVALTLSPLMCASFLNKNTKQFCPAIDVFFDTLSKKYCVLFTRIICKKELTLFIVMLSIGLTVFLYKLLPSEVSPKEDRGLIGVFVPRSSGDDLKSMDETLKQIDSAVGIVDETENKLTFSGGWGANFVMPLKSHSERKRTAEQIVQSLKTKMITVPSTDAHVWNWDTGLPGSDEAMNGNDLSLVISSTDAFSQLLDNTEHFKSIIDKNKMFASSSHNLRLDSIGYSIKVDKNTLAKLGITSRQVAKTIEIFFSGDRSTTFQKDNVVYNLTLQGTTRPWTLDELYITTASGKRVSLGALAKMEKISQPMQLEHVNQMRSVNLSVQLAPHQSFEKGMDVLWSMAKEHLPSQYKLSWSGAAKASIESSHKMLLLFILSIVFIYAILTVQFEDFIYPLIILFTIPLACSGALLFAYVFGQSLNIFTQVGLITLVGLIAKHGILIVEFANQLQIEGYSLIEAIKTSCSLRLRPILMTTAAMVFGVLPLVLSHDAGAESRRAIGIILVGGLGIGTLFTLFVLPAVYYFVSVSRDLWSVKDIGAVNECHYK